MKTMSYTKLKENLKKNPYKEYGTKFFDFNGLGYRYGNNTTPGYLIMNMCFKMPVKDLYRMLQEKFNIKPVMKRGSEANYHIVSFLFEGEEFKIWFNTTHKGTIVDTACNSLSKYHRFCVKFLKQADFVVPEDYMWAYEDRPELLTKNRKLVKDYMQDVLLSDKKFHEDTQSRHLKGKV